MKNRLRVLRAEREWSQSELAARLDVSCQTVCSNQAEKCHHEVVVEGAAFKSMAVTGPWDERVVVVSDSAGSG